MIKIEISSNTSTPLDYHYHKNTLTIGKSNKCDIVINDIKSQSVDLILLVDKKGFYGTGISNSNCLYKGKKLSGKKLFKKEDTITIGNTSIKIKDYSFKLHSFDKETLPLLNQNALSENPQLKFIINALSKELINLLKKHHVQK